MGSGMATRLLSRGFVVTVFNRSPQKAEALRSLGAAVASTPYEAAGRSTFIISMLADDEASREVWLGKDGALAGATPGSLLIESSTVTVDWIHELAAAAAARGLDLLDAPVAGSKVAAASGELTYLVGGSESVLERARPVLSNLSREINHLGPTGSGALMKLINNYLCGIQAVGLAEAIAAIERSSLNREKAVGVLTGGAPGSPIVKMLAARMLARNYDTNFAMKLIAKDIRYAHHQFGQTDIGQAALGALQKGIDAGLGEQDFSAVVESLRAETITPSP